MTNFISPIKDCYWTSAFGWRTHPVTGKKESWHQGIDLALQPNTNVPILAVADGTVVRTGPLGTYGNIVIIQHNINGKIMETNYAHLKDGSILVKAKDKVKQGQKIATMGNTGSSTAPHLHFEIHNGKWVSGQPNAVNPANYIKFISKVEWLAKQAQIKLAEQMAKELEEKIAAQKAKELAEKLEAEKKALAEKKAKEEAEAKKKAEELAKKSTIKKLYLPKTADSWNIYPLNKQPIKKNAIGSLNPKKFGGLSYDILGNPFTDVYTINTKDFGKVNIYAGKSTGATVK